MKLLHIKVTNFLPFIGSYEFNFQDCGAAAVVSGPNGSGKSSFFIDAPLFALFGKARKRPEELVNDSSQEMEVVLHFEHRDSLYEVTRSIKKGKTQSLKLVSMNKGGEEREISERLLSNTQKKLEEILGFSFNLLLSTAVAQQDEINKLSVMTPSEREQIVTEMLSLSVWEEKKKKVQEILLDFKKHEEEIEHLEDDIEIAGREISSLKFGIQKNIDEVQKIESSHDSALRVLEELEEQFREVEKSQVLSTEIASLSSKIEQRKQRLSQIKGPEDPQKIQFQIEKCNDDIREYIQLQSDVTASLPELSKQIDDLQSKISTGQRYLQSLGGTALLNEVPCRGMDIHSQCKLLQNAHVTKQNLDNFLTGIRHIAPTLEEYLEKLNFKKNELSGRHKEFLLSKEQLFVRQQEAKEQKQELERFLKESEEAKKIIAELKNDEGHLRYLQGCLDLLPKVSVDRLIAARQHYKQLDSQVSDLRGKIKNSSTNLEACQKVSSEKRARLDNLSDIKRKAALYRTLQTAYNEIPTLLFTEVIPHIEMYANQMLTRISPERRILLRAYKDTKAGTQTKALDVIGTAPTGSRDFDNLSGSEKFRQSLALRIALAKVNAELYNTQINFFIVDEGFGSLDEINLSLTKLALREAAKEFDSFLVISHVAELADAFDTKIIVNSQGSNKQISIFKQNQSSEVPLDI